MIIRGIEEHDLRAALEVTNYVYRGNLRFREGPEPLTRCHQDWRMSLGVEDLDGPGYRHCEPQTWWDRSRGNRKAGHSNAACYHAHRDFLYAVFERAPRARVVTALVAYDGLRSFESDHRRVGKLNMGSFFEPIPFEGCCDCAKRFPRVEAMVPEAYLEEEYALKPHPQIYSGPYLPKSR